MCFVEGEMRAWWCVLCDGGVVHVSGRGIFPFPSGLGELDDLVHEGCGRIFGYGVNVVGKIFEGAPTMLFLRCGHIFWVDTFFFNGRV